MKKYLILLFSFLFSFYFIGCTKKSVYFQNLEIPSEISSRYTLPKEIDGYKLAWSCDIPSYIGIDNIISPFYTEDKHITLTASVYIDDKKYSQEYKVYVKKYEYKDTDNDEFNNYLEALFIDILKGDPLSINFLLLNPAVYGLENEKVNDMSVVVTAADVFAKLSSFNYSDLSLNQQFQYDIIDYYWRNVGLTNEYSLLTTSLGSYLGYNAELPLVLGEYHFYSEKDINDYFQYIELVDEDFNEIVEFEKEKIEQGLGLPDYILNGAIAQCETLLSEECCLIPMFKDKINECDFLEQEEKVNYQEYHENLVEDEFLSAYQYLLDELKLMLGKSTNDLGLAHFENGAQYYEALMQQSCATSMTCEQMVEYLEEKIDEDLKTILSCGNSLLKEYNKLDLLQDMSLDECFEFIAEATKDDFPSVGEYTYSLNSVHSSLQGHTSPAYYFSSVIDADVCESIYIDTSQMENMDLYDKNNMFQTIAHEGYPGHMYQQLYSKNIANINNVLMTQSFSCFSEGYAWYAEDYVLKYAINNETLIDLYKADTKLAYYVYCRCDIGINYEGWDYSDVYDYFSEHYFSLTLDAAKSIVEFLREVPTNYLTYVFGYLQILDLQEYAKAELKELYKDYDFHQAILSNGDVPWSVLCKAVDIYIYNKKC